MSVINPVTSILLESLAVFAIVKALEKRHIVLPVFAAGLLWISAFTFIQAVVLRPPAGLWLQPLSVQAGTVLLTAGVSTVFISLYLIRRTETVPRPLPAMHGFALPALALGTALALELLNSLI
jgi:hypothetical protein